MKRLLLFASVITILSSCDTSSTDDRVPALYGRIVSEGGDPISDVAVHYRFNFSPADALQEQDEWSTIISFAIPQTDSVLLQIVRHGTEEVAHVIWDEPLAAGSFNWVLEPFILTTGLYSIQLVYQDSTRQRPLVVHANNSYLAQTPSFIQSDNRGEFQIDYDILGIGEIVELLTMEREPTEVMILNNIDLIAIKDGFTPLEESINLDETEVQDVTLVLQRE